MTMQVVIGSAIIVAAIFIHIGVTTAFELSVQRQHLWPGKHGSLLRFTSLLLGMTLLLLMSISLSVWLWALCLMWLGVFPEPEPSMYFALVSFTTLGYGDIVLDKQWRILSGMMAANGLLIFGLTTAVLVDFLSRFRRADDHSAVRRRIVKRRTRKARKPIGPRKKVKRRQGSTA
jgi:Ion channel